MFTIALVQKKALPNQPQANLKLAVSSIKEAQRMGADLVLFPEMWSNGYAPPYESAFEDPFAPAFAQQRKNWLEQAIPLHGRYVKALQETAKACRIGVAATFLARTPGKPQNMAILIDRNGKILLQYAKVHTCDFSLEALLEGGREFKVCDFEGIRLGIMICYDREFPESARILMLKGAELILVPNACPMEINRLSQLRARAFENMTAIDTCNYPASVPDCNGGSSVFDGMAYLPEMETSRDTCILMAGKEEGIFLAALDLGKLREYRRTEMMGNTFRRPDLYGMLVKEGVEEPFIRDGYRGKKERIPGI